MFYRIRATRSAIGMPKTIRETLESMGLTKRGRVVYLRVSPGSAGQILKVKELVNVQLVNNALSTEEERRLRAPASGFHVVSKQ